MTQLPAKVQMALLLTNNQRYTSLCRQFVSLVPIYIFCRKHGNHNMNVYYASSNLIRFKGSATNLHCFRSFLATNLSIVIHSTASLTKNVV